MARPIGKFGPGEGRGFKRFARKQGMSHPVDIAYTEGEALAYFGARRMPERLWRNPYPPGRRHDAWEQGFRGADPLGDFHGRNE